MTGQAETAQTRPQSRRDQRLAISERERTPAECAGNVSVIGHAVWYGRNRSDLAPHREMQRAGGVGHVPAHGLPIHLAG
jgi:hypothetical protein